MFSDPFGVLLSSMIPTDFGKKEFWYKRYENLKPTRLYDWYISYAQLRPVFQEHVTHFKPFYHDKKANVPHPQVRVLHFERSFLYFLFFAGVNQPSTETLQRLKFSALIKDKPFAKTVGG